MKVQRYELYWVSDFAGHGQQMCADNDGTYVLHSDYEKLEKQNRELRIGDITISMFDEKSLWLQKVDGEGQQISAETFAQFFKENM